MGCLAHVTGLERRKDVPHKYQDFSVCNAAPLAYYLATESYLYQARSHSSSFFKFLIYLFIYLFIYYLYIYLSIYLCVGVTV